MNIRPLSDLGLIAGLITLGYQPLERIKVPGSTRINFIFEADEYFDGLCDDYYNNRMEVDAQKYSANLREVKSGIRRLEQVNQSQ